jgi:hypothetical protein
MERLRQPEPEPESIACPYSWQHVRSTGPPANRLRQQPPRPRTPFHGPTAECRQHASAPPLPQAHTDLVYLPPTTNSNRKNAHGDCRLTQSPAGRPSHRRRQRGRLATRATSCGRHRPRDVGHGPRRIAARTCRKRPRRLPAVTYALTRARAPATGGRRARRATGQLRA